MKNTVFPTLDTPSIAYEAYQAFLLQLAWPRTVPAWISGLSVLYYKVHQVGEFYADMVLRDELSTAVRSSTLVAQTAQAANQLVTSTDVDYYQLRASLKQEL